MIKKAAITVATAGKNEGYTLSHLQIVSNMQNIPLTTKPGGANLNLPVDFSEGNFEVIAFVENASRPVSLSPLHG